MRVSIVTGDGTTTYTENIRQVAVEEEDFSTVLAFVSDSLALNLYHSGQHPFLFLKNFWKLNCENRNSYLLNVFKCIIHPVFVVGNT